MAACSSRSPQNQSVTSQGAGIAGCRSLMGGLVPCAPVSLNLNLCLSVTSRVGGQGSDTKGFGFFGCISGNSQCGRWDEFVERGLSADCQWLCFKDSCITRETKQTSPRALAKAPSSGCTWTRGTGPSHSSKTASALVRRRAGATAWQRDRERGSSRMGRFQLLFGQTGISKGCFPTALKLIGPGLLGGGR